MAFDSGFAAFETAIREGKERASGSFGPRLNYFSWKDGDVKILRFLTDDPIVGNFAEWVITNDGKSADFLIDPDGTNWVEHFGGMSRERGNSGALVAPKVAKRGVGVAVLRDERPKAGGGTEIVDHFSTFQSKKDNQSYHSRYFGIVKLSMGNFWEQLIGICRRNGTICDRDFEITREGADMNTKYKISPVDPIEELRDPDAVRQFYGYGRAYNEQDPERYLFCPQTLPEWCEYYSGEERAKRLLLPKQGGAAPATVGSYQPAAYAPQPAGYAPVLSTATGQPVVHQQAVPAQPAGLQQQYVSVPQQPAYAQPTVAAPNLPGATWAGAEDEAQAVSTSASQFADIRSKLMPHLSQPQQ